MRKPEWCIKEKKKKEQTNKTTWYSLSWRSYRQERKKKKKKEYYFSAPISNMLTVSFGRHLEKKHAGNQGLISAINLRMSMGKSESPVNAIFFECFVPTGTCPGSPSFESLKLSYVALFFLKYIYYIYICSIWCF